MVKSRRRSTALKMACAAMCTALCIEGMLQRGLYVSVHAEDAAAQLALTIEWLTSTPEELELFAVTAFGSVEAAMMNPTFAAVWAGYKEAKWFLENPTLEAGSDVNDSISVQNLHPMVGYYYRLNGVQSPVFWYDLDLLDGLTNNHIDGLPVLSCADFTLRISCRNDPDNSGAYPYISRIQKVDGINGAAFGGYRIYIQPSFNQQFYANFDSSSFFTGTAQGERLVSGSATIGYAVGNESSIPTLNPNTNLYYSSAFGTYGMQISGSGSVLSLSSLPDIGVKQMFVPATASNWINNEFYPYVASQTEEGQPLEGFELTPPPGSTPDLPDTGELDSLTFPPGLPSASFNDVELPSEPLPAKMLSGASFWFSSFTSMLDALGVKYIVITFLIIALIMAILKI